MALFACAVCWVPVGVRAQDDLPDQSTVAGRLDSAWEHLRDSEYIEAREQVESVLREDPNNIRAHFILGAVHHFGEANFPRALYHLQRAEGLYEQQWPEDPDDPDIQLLHQLLLRQLSFTESSLEHYEASLHYMDLHDALYEPHFLAERAWPLMKLRRFSEARSIARRGLVASDPRQSEIALNALCAIEFEGGNDQESYESCGRAVQYARDQGQVNVVDLTNFAESSRSLFRFDEAERLLVEATRANVTWFGNPWLELAELYLREGRFLEGVDALKRVGPYRAQRPPHVRNADLNEGRRVIAQLFLLLGRADEALEITERAQLLQDRRGHVSRDPEQDHAIIELLAREAELQVAERIQEQAADRWFGVRWLAYGESLWHRTVAWRHGREAARRLSQPERLIGLFRIGRAEAGITPSWLAGDLVDVLGAGVVNTALQRGRRDDVRPGSDAYYDAFQVDVAHANGDHAALARYASQALSGLNPSERLLRARVHALWADSEDEFGNAEASESHYSSAFQRDPGVFRRLGLAVPVYFQPSGELGQEIATALAHSPRFQETSERTHGLTVVVQASEANANASLQLRDGTVLSSLTVSREHDQDKEDVDAYVHRVVHEFHQIAFAPRVELSQADAGSLDGSNQVTRNPLRTLFGN